VVYKIIRNKTSLFGDFIIAVENGLAFTYLLASVASYIYGAIEFLRN
jgi:hypothetical protein